MKMGARYALIRHKDYFDCLNQSEGPDWVEFNLYDTPNPVDRFHHPFFHLDCYNLRAIADTVTAEDYPEAMVSRVQKSHQVFLKGTDEYMIDLLFSESGAAYYYGRKLPAGETLFTLDLAGEKPEYAYLYLRETSPLTPEVLCRHLEKLSAALFGDEKHYEIR